MPRHRGKGEARPYSTSSSAGNGSVLICEICFGLYFQTRTFGHPRPCPFSIAVRSSLARDLRRLRQSGLRRTSSRATAGPERDPCHQRIQADISRCHPPALGQKFCPRPPRCEGLHAAALVNCGRSAGRSNSSAEQGGGKRRAALAYQGRPPGSAGEAATV